MNRKRKTQQIRKEIMRLGKITSISAPDDSWYQAYKGCLEAEKMAMEMEPFGGTIDVW